MLVDISVINQWSKLCGQSEADGQKLPLIDSENRARQN